MRGKGLLALALATTLAALGACVSTEDSVRTQEAAAAAPPPAEGMRGITLRNFREGDTRWVLQADTASVFRDRKRVEAQVVTINFFDGDRHVSKLTSDRSVLLQATDDLEARGHVRVVSDEGAILTTDVLFWDHQRSRIHTDDPVQITRGDDVLTGVGMEADPGLSRVDLKREVRGSVRSNPDSLLPGGSSR
ncbi:MAG: LPS export ABC transporter periplasmic protein LptC [bacterium]